MSNLAKEQKPEALKRPLVKSEPGPSRIVYANDLAKEIQQAIEKGDKK